MEGHDSIEIPFLSDEGIIAEVATLYGSGLRIPQISKHLKIARSTVRTKLTRAGISFQEEKGIQNPLSKRNSGKPRWNSPYGLLYLEGRLAPHPQEFEVLRLILEWSKAGHSYREIAAELNSRRLRPRTAKVWTRFTIRQIVLWHAERPDVLRSAAGHNYPTPAEGQNIST